MSDTFKPRVREYTQDEKIAMHFEPGVPVAEKVARLIQTHAIEIDRYQEAAVVHPEMSDHFNGLIAATNTYYGTALEQTFIPAPEAASELVA